MGRNPEDGVRQWIERLAKRRGRGMEHEVRHFLCNAAREHHSGVRKVGSRIAARFRKVGLTADLPELHGEHAALAWFDR